MPRKPSRDTYDRDWFLARVTVDESGCWLWNGATSRGYGMINRTVYRGPVHRFAYRMLKGEVPNDWPLDHLCRVTHCCNPDHLEPVTHRTNILRSTAPSAINAAKTHCINGHELSGDNLFLSSHGGRECRTCRRERELRRTELRRLNGGKHVRKADQPSAG